MKKKSRIAGNILQVDYDRVLSLSDDECCFSLSEKEVAMILSQTEYFGWQTRWNSVSETPIDQDEIDALQSGLERKLMSGCCPDEGRMGRYTADGVYQTSDDGGATWEDNPEADPRNQGTQAPPLGGTGTNTKCAAADNARDVFKSYKATVRSLLEAGTTVLAIVAGLVGALGFLLGLTGVALPIGVLLFGLAAALLSLTPEELDDALTDAIFDDFRCILYCNMQENGQFTYDNWQTVLDEIDSTFTGFPQQFFHAIVAAMGFIGLSNAGTVGVATADDCDDCDCNEGCGFNWEPWDRTGEGYPPPPYFGEILEQDADHIRVQYHSNYILIKTPDNATCCYVQGWEVVEGGDVYSTAHQLCGEPFPTGGIFAHNTTMLNQCVWFFEMQSLGADRPIVDIFFSECP